MSSQTRSFGHSEVLMPPAASLYLLRLNAALPANIASHCAGGAMALLALRSQHKLAGIVALSGYLPLRQSPPLIAPENMETPVLMCHGDADPTVSSFTLLLSDSWQQETWDLQQAGTVICNTCLTPEGPFMQVRFRFGQMSAEMLKEAGAKLEFKSYVGLHHGVNTAEITDVVAYIASVLS